jgi:hypothetical protein
MPTPTLITSSGPRLPKTNFRPGPYHYNGTNFVVMTDWTNSNIEVWKSGSTPWTECDSANHPLTSTDLFQNKEGSSYPSIDGRYIIIAYLPRGDTQIAFIKFDMQTETYGTPVTGGPSQEVDAVGGYYTYYPAEFSNGDIALVYTTKRTDLFNSAQCELMLRSGGAWGSPIIVAEPGVTDVAPVHYTPAGVVVDSEDRLHIAISNGYYTFSYVTYRNGTLNDIVKIMSVVQLFITAFGLGPPEVYTACGIEYVVIPVMLQHSVINDTDPDTILVPSAMIFRVADSPNSVRIDHCYDLVWGWYEEDPDWWAAFATPAAVVFNGAIHLYYTKVESGSTAFVDADVRRTSSKLVGWSAPETVIDSASDVSDYAQRICARVCGNTIGVIIESPNSAFYTYQYAHYFEETPNPMLESVCSSGAASRHRSFH